MTSLDDFEDFDQEIHRRLLDNDPIAPSQLGYKYLERLVSWLESQFLEVRDKTLIREAALEAFFNYLQNPSCFNPTQCSLFSYLQMSAKRDMLNILDKEKRRKKRERKLLDKILPEVVEQTTINCNKLQEDRELLISKESGNEQDMIKQIIEEKFPAPLDRKLLPLILDNERKTSAFVPILGIQDQNEVEQQKIVKRHKDRINKRIERLKRRFRGEIS